MGVLLNLNIMKVLPVLLSLLVLLPLPWCVVSLPALGAASPKSLTCDLCMDVITDLDAWLTSETTEQQIIDYIKQICPTIGELVSPDLEATCNLVLAATLPAIIEGLVEQNLNPTEVCQSIGAC